MQKKNKWFGILVLLVIVLPVVILLILIRLLLLRRGEGRTAVGAEFIAVGTVRSAFRTDHSVHSLSHWLGACAPAAIIAQLIIDVNMSCAAETVDAAAEETPGHRTMPGARSRQGKPT